MANVTNEINTQNGPPAKQLVACYESRELRFWDAGKAAGSDVTGPARHLLAQPAGPEAQTPPLARGRGGFWTTSCLKLLPALVRPFARGALAGLAFLPALRAPTGFAVP